MIYDMLYIHLNMKMKILVLKLLWNITRIPRYMDLYIYACVYDGISPLDSKPTGLKFSKISKFPNLTMTLFIVDLPYDLPLKGCYEKKEPYAPKEVPTFTGFI